MQRKRVIFLGSLALAFVIFQALSSYGFRRDVTHAVHMWFGKDDRIPKKLLGSLSSQPMPTLIDVGAEQCAPCKRMAPVMVELQEEYAGSLRVEFIDVWKHKDAEEQYRIRVIPTQIFDDLSGKELKRHYGYMSKEEILKVFRDLGFDLKKPGDAKQ